MIAAMAVINLQGGYDCYCRVGYVPSSVNTHNCEGKSYLHLSNNRSILGYGRRMCRYAEKQFFLLNEIDKWYKD